MIISIGFTSCEKKTIIEYPDCLEQFGEFEPNNKPGKGTVEFIFYDRSDLKVTEYDRGVSVEKVAGNKLVFKYQYVADDEPNIADDEYSEIIWFVVDPKGDSFEIHSDDFEDSGASFGRMCFCADGGFHWISDGCIYGKKTGEGKWEVSIAIQSETNYDKYTRMIQADFLASL